MKKEKEFTEFLCIIPYEIISDNILPRLPVKSLVRFKSVSKTWYSLISSPKFSSFFPPHFLFRVNKSLSLLSYDLNNKFKQLVKLDFPCENKRNKFTIDVVGSCNGLLCLFIREPHAYFIVWNPATCQHRKVPTPSCYQQQSRLPSCFGTRSRSVLGPRLCKRGFGYVSSSPVAVGGDDYKILLNSHLCNSKCLWVFSLRLGEWTSIDLPSDHPFRGFRNLHNTTGIHLDGTLYWDIFEKPSVYTICSFNLVDEQFNQAPFVIPPTMFQYGLSRLCLFKGWLSFICHGCDQSDVFVLKRKGDLTSWENLFSLPCVSYATFVDFAITGKCLVGHVTPMIQSVFEDSHNTSEGSIIPTRWKYELKLVDASLDDLEHSPGIGYEHQYVDSVHQYAESFISPFTLT